MAGKQLTPKQQRFVDEYLVDLNATQAAIRAGYSEKTARTQAAHLLAKDNIAAVIQKRQAERAERTELTQDEVINDFREIRDLALGRKPKVVKLRQGDGEWAEQEVYDYDLANAHRANEALGRHLKLFTDRVEHTADDELARKLAEGRQRVGNGQGGE
jgi:phage terminase small subunit